MIELILWYVAVSIAFFLAFTFFRQYLKRESLQKPFFFGLTIFAVCYGVARLIENIRRYSIGSYNDVLEAWIAGTQITETNLIMRFLYYFIAWAGISIMFFNIEKHIFKKNRYFLTISSIIEAVVSIINYVYFNLITFYLSAALFFVIMFMPVMFLMLAKKTPAGSIRNACIMLAVGITCFAIAVMIDLPEFAYISSHLLNQPFPETEIRIIAPLVLISGVIIIYIGFNKFFPKD